MTTTRISMGKTVKMNRRSILRIGKGLGVSAALWPLLRNLPSYAQDNARPEHAETSGFWSFGIPTECTNPAGRLAPAIAAATTGSLVGYLIRCSR